MMCLLTQATMPHITFLFVSTGFCRLASLPVRSGWLQCLGCPIPPCHLLILPGVTPVYKGLAPSGKMHTCCFVHLKVYLYFTTFSRAYNKCARCSCRAHTCNIAKKGFRGIRSASPASNFIPVDRDVPRIPSVIT